MVAQFIRINPRSRSSQIEMRVEVYGCVRSNPLSINEPQLSVFGQDLETAVKRIVVEKQRAPVVTRIVEVRSKTEPICSLSLEAILAQLTDRG